MARLSLATDSMEDARLARHGAPSTARQLFSVFGGPVAWNAQLAATFALATYPCLSGGVVHAPMLGGWESSRWWFAGINVLAQLITLLALTAAVYAMRWSRGMRARGQPQPRIVARTQALALCGTLSSLIFETANIFSLVAMLSTAQCSN